MAADAAALTDTHQGSSLVASGSGGGRDASPSAKAQRHAALACVAVACAAAAVPTLGGELGLMDAWSRPFVERDPNLSWPEVGPEEVSTGLLFVLALLLPCVGVSSVHWALARASKPVAAARKDAAALALALLAACFWTMAVTDTLKLFVGRQRPYFFAACNYAGFADGVGSQYLAATQAGAPGDLSKCLAPPVQWKPQALLSFPSGHASLSACGLGWAAAYAAWAVRACGGRRWWAAGAAAAAAAPMVLTALLVAASRTRDGRHHYGTWGTKP